MSLLYKENKDLIYSLTIKGVDKEIENKITLTFYNDGGKFGTHEILDEHEISIKELLELLQEN